MSIKVRENLKLIMNIVLRGGLDRNVERYKTHMEIRKKEK